MTIVASFATHDHAIIVADKRRTQLSSGQYYDDVTKLYRASDQILIGFAGSYFLEESGKSYLGIAERVLNSVELRTEDTIENVAERLTNMCRRLPPELDGVSFLLAGMTRLGYFGLGRVSCFEDYRYEISVAASSGFAWNLIQAEYDLTPWLGQQEKQLRNPVLTDLYAMAKDVVETAAANDSYCSPTYDLLVLSRHRI